MACWSASRSASSGGGGSILTVPIPVYVLGETVHLATGTALAIVGANALIGAWSHQRAGRVRLSVALLFGGAGISGALAGSWLNHLAPARMVLLGLAVLMLGGGPGYGPGGADRPHGGTSARSPRVSPSRGWSWAC